jgi:hypothetical protein
MAVLTTLEIRSNAQVDARKYTGMEMARSKADPTLNFTPLTRGHEVAQL